MTRMYYAPCIKQGNKVSVPRIFRGSHVANTAEPPISVTASEMANYQDKVHEHLYVPKNQQAAPHIWTDGME